MTARTLAERIAALLALDEARTQGKWTATKSPHGGALLTRDCDQPSIQIVPLADAEFISAAPEMIAVIWELVTQLADANHQLQVERQERRWETGQEP